MIAIYSALINFSNNVLRASIPDSAVNLLELLLNMYKDSTDMEEFWLDITSLDRDILVKFLDALSDGLIHE